MSQVTMEARFKVELGEMEPDQVQDLVIDDCNASEITGLDDRLVNLQSLTILNVGLKSLKGLPVLPSLIKLDLSNNLITGDLDIITKNCPALLHLNLSGNKIADLSVLEPLKESTMCELDLFSNVVSLDEGHREKVFELLDKLQILDGCDVNGEEVEDDEASVLGEDEEESEEDSDAEDGPGLSFLDRSQIEEDDESDEEYEPVAKKKKASGDADDAEEAPEEA